MKKNIYIYSQDRVSDEAVTFFREVLDCIDKVGAKFTTLINAADLRIVLGGDGSVLRAAREGGNACPTLVINTGHLGFLTSTTKELFRAAILSFVNNTYTVTERNMLDVTLLYEFQKGDGLRESGTIHALNEVVIAKNTLSKLVKVAVYALEPDREEEMVAEYRADGLIVSTPTGSTAYNLSASGPIIHPRCPSFVITPICPQGLTHRPIVLPSYFSLRIKPLEADLSISIDGQIERHLDLNAILSIKYNSATIKTVNPTGSYFQVLREKLAWGIKPV